MIIRRERPADTSEIGSVTSRAFRAAEHSAGPAEPGGEPGEVALIEHLRTDPGWIAELSFVAVHGDQIVGHIVGSRAAVGDRPAIGLGPLSVVPNRQRSGVGRALMHTVLGAADALGESIVGLLGDPEYYRRFGFVSASAYDVQAPAVGWGDYFQVRTLSGYDGATGRFTYAAPFDAV